MADVDIERVKSRIAGIKAERGPEPGLVPPPRQTPVTDETELVRFLAPVLERGGFDLAAFEKLLAEDPSPEPRKPTAEAVRRHVLAKERAVRKMRAAPGARDGRQLPLDPPVTEVIQPFFIWAQPVGILAQSNLADGDNSAQVQFETSGDGGSYISFLYLWNNPNAYAVDVDIDTTVAFLGFASVRSFGGWLPTLRVSNAHVQTFMTIYQGGADGTVSSPSIHVLDLHAHSTFGSASNSAPLDSLIDVAYDLAVSGGETIVIEVYASFTYTNWHGRATFDFAGRDFQIRPPA